MLYNKFLQEISVQKPFARYLPCINFFVSGIEGFEPSIFVSKTKALTIWPYPNNILKYVFNFFIPAARSRTTTLLRLHPSYEFYNNPKKINPLLKIEKILILKYPLKRFQIKLTPGM